MAKRPHITETTRKNLMDAFWKLYLTKSIENITVKEVTDIAGYNRGTFYLYFKDIYDVLEQIENEVFEILNDEFVKYADAFHCNKESLDITEITSATLATFKACDYKPFILLSDKGDPRFEKAMKDNLRSRLDCLTGYLTEFDDITKEYIIHFFISGVIGVIKKWYSDGMVIPVEEHLKTVCNVLFGSKKMLAEVFEKKGKEA